MVRSARSNGMRVEALYIYPIKSGPGVSVTEAEMLERGFDHDRRFMVTTPEGTFLSQRSHPALGRCALTLEPGTVAVAAEGIGECRWDLQPSAVTTGEAKVWKDTVAVARVSDDADAFFTALLGEPAQLVSMPEPSRRPVAGFEDIAVSFADGFPYLVANTASLDDLNRRIEGSPLPMLAFRPNVVVRSDTPWAEDGWTRLQLGDGVLECVTNCERCSVTTLDPHSPDRPRPDGEPLRTLAKFRRGESGAVEFARNAIARSAGVIRVGDAVRVG